MGPSFVLLGLAKGHVSFDNEYEIAVDAPLCFVLVGNLIYINNPANKFMYVQCNEMTFSLKFHASY